MQDGDADAVRQDVYAPPRAPVADVVDDRARAEATEFLVVSSGKFWCLFVATFGLYGYYWFYRHWASYRSWHREPLSPVARAIFSIFVIHSLNSHIDTALRKANIRHDWWPAASATGYVVLSIFAGVCASLAGRVETLSWLDYVNIASLLPIGLTIAATQRAANAACGDRDGAKNARLTLANWIWIALGGVWWTLIVIGFLLPAETG